MYIQQLENIENTSILDENGNENEDDDDDDDDENSNDNPSIDDDIPNVTFDNNLDQKLRLAIYNFNTTDI